MFEFYNPHPRGILTGDCVVRAVSIATGKDYLACRRELNKAKKELGYDTYTRTDFVKEYLTRYKKVSCQPVAGRKRVRGFDFAKSHSNGVYILHMRHHVVACVKGKILDTWDSSNNIVYCAWVIE